MSAVSEDPQSAAAMLGGSLHRHKKHTPTLGWGAIFGCIYSPFNGDPFFHTVKESGGEPATASLSVSPDPELPSLLSQVRHRSCQTSTHPQQPLVPVAVGFDVSSPGASPVNHDIYIYIYNSLFSQTQERPRAVCTFRWNHNPSPLLSTAQCLSGLTDHFLFKTLIEIRTINNLPNWV